MAWTPAHPAIAIRKVLAARANPMATNRLARVAPVVRGPVVHAQAVRVPMATARPVAMPVIAARVGKVATVQARAKGVQHVPRVRMDIRVTRRTSRPIMPTPATSIRMANVHVEIARLAIVLAKAHAQVGRADQSPAARVDRSLVAHAVAIAETPG